MIVIVHPTAIAFRFQHFKISQFTNDSLISCDLNSSRLSSIDPTRKAPSQPRIPSLSILDPDQRTATQLHYRHRVFLPALFDSNFKSICVTAHQYKLARVPPVPRENPGR